VSTGWIRGRFEGTYAGELTAVGGDGARTFTIVLQSGTVHDAVWVPPPADAGANLGGDGDAGSASLHTRRRLGHVRFAPPGEPERVGTLYDLRVEVTRLRRAHEVGSRSFGKLEGVVIARTEAEALVDAQGAPEAADGPAPPPPQPAPRPGEQPAPAAPASIEPASTDASAGVVEQSRPKPLALPEPEPLRPYVQPIHRTSALPIEPVPKGFHPAWLIVALVMGWLGLSTWLMCGPLAAASWAAPLLLGTLLRRGTLRLRLRFAEALGWTSFVLLATQLALLVGPAEHAWRADCLPPLGLRLPLLGGLVMLTVLLSRVGPIAIAALCWTLLTFGWCDHVDGTCGERAALARADRRWPKDPERAAAAVTMPQAGAETTAPGPTPQVDVAPKATAAVEPPRHAAAEPTASPAAAAAAPPLPPSTPREPPHPAKPLSMEQANRTPASFFASKGKRSVVLPSAPIFGQHGAEVSAEGTIELSRLAALLKLQGKRRVRLELHTEARGDAGREQELTNLQAHAVRMWLEHSGGVEVSRLEVAGLGSRRPLAALALDSEVPDTDARLELHVLDSAPGRGVAPNAELPGAARQR
jgi:outer membrane protein OmpA-like peptidoglycan-associated protein